MAAERRQLAALFHPPAATTHHAIICLPVPIKPQRPVVAGNFDSIATPTGHKRKKGVNVIIDTAYKCARIYNWYSCLGTRECGHQRASAYLHISLVCCGRLFPFRIMRPYPPTRLPDLDEKTRGEEGTRGGEGSHS